MDAVVVRWGAVDLAHSFFGFFATAFTESIARRLWEKKDAEAENDGPEPADPEGDTPRGRVILLVFVGAKVNACRKENAQGDEELVSADQRTSDVSWRRFS